MSRLRFSVLPLWIGCLTLILLSTNTYAQSQPRLTLQVTNSSARLSVTGNIGSPISFQYRTGFGTNTAWVALSNITLLSNPFTALDPSAASTQRFYRAAITVPSNFVWIPAGSFLMGSPTNEVTRVSTVETQHNVTLSRGFYLSKFLVRQSDYRSLMNTNPSYFNTNNGYTLDLSRPVEQVSWSDATNYCGKLTQQAQLAGSLFANWAYRLPTEAEWEYACRAGTTNVFSYGNNLSNGMANFNSESEYVGGIGTVVNSTAVPANRPVAVGGYQPNNFGAYDMVGNVWEWCQDWFANYTASPVTNPQGPATGSQRVFRGGAFNSPGAVCRSANRNKTDPAFGANTIGFRVVFAGF
jgi:formylglycine-generating enzyme required for sulfatase activity